MKIYLSLTESLSVVYIKYSSNCMPELNFLAFLVFNNECCVEIVNFFNT